MLTKLAKIPIWLLPDEEEHEGKHLLWQEEEQPEDAKEHGEDGDIPKLLEAVVLKEVADRLADAGRT